MSETMIKRGPGRPAKPPFSGDIGTIEPNEWFQMSDAPKDGRIIEITPDHHESVKAVWHRTRSRVGGQKWQMKEYWATPTISKQKIGFEPVAWREVAPFRADLGVS